MSSPIAARIEIFRVLFDKAADISRPIGNPGLFPRGSRHVFPVVTCWTVHVNLIETFRLAAYVYTRKMCYSRNASTKVPGNRKVNRFLSRRCACVCVCATRGETSNYLDSERENALCKMARRKEASLDWPIMMCN